MNSKKSPAIHSRSTAKQSLSNNGTIKGTAHRLLATYGKALLGCSFNALLVLGTASLPALAQGGPGPFGGSGTTKLANAGANVMVIGTWISFFVGLLSFVLIPIFIKFEWNYKKLIMSGITGLGGFAVLGAVAYDIVNLSSTTMTDPTLGR